MADFQQKQLLLFRIQLVWSLLLGYDLVFVTLAVTDITIFALFAYQQVSKV